MNIFWSECVWVNIPVAVLAFRRFLAWLGFWLGAGTTRWPASLRRVSWSPWYCWRQIWGEGVQQASWRHHASWWLGQAWLQRAGKLPLLMQNVIALILSNKSIKQFCRCISVYLCTLIFIDSAQLMFSSCFYLNLL